MYWLLDYETQEIVRNKIIKLQSNIIDTPVSRNQHEQVFPFNGRKDRLTASTIIRSLVDNPAEAIICDPFCGSGTFAYAGADAGCQVLANEWEPYAFRMMSAPLRYIPTAVELKEGLETFKQATEPNIFSIYKTRCPQCGKEIMFDSLFYDREPEEYFHPKKHGRMGKNGENIVFRGKYKCTCKCTEKFFDDEDEQNLRNIKNVKFPNPTLIENSRINFTSPDFTHYANLFSRRQKAALIEIQKGIKMLPDHVRPFFEDAFISIVHLAKYTDYHSKSQDNHCPEFFLRENNLYHRFIDRIKERFDYLRLQNFDKNRVQLSCKDFRDFFTGIAEKSINIVLTDPPYGDNAQYFEHAQRVHPFMDYNLSKDKDRLTKEVVISNAPSRLKKQGKEQFLKDIETLFSESARVLMDHGYLVLYFRPTQSDWISDLNKLKSFGRKHGMEPLVSMSIENSDPSMRVLRSAAWTFKNDVCFVFLKLKDTERRWYEGDEDVDEIVYLAALKAATDEGKSFTYQKFLVCLQSELRSKRLMKLSHQRYAEKFRLTLERFTYRNGNQYNLKGSSPYDYMNRNMNPEMRLREFVPIVIEELSTKEEGFTFEDYVLHLSSYLENGTKKIIDQLHRANRLIPELLSVYAEEDKEKQRFFVKKTGYSEITEDTSKIYLRKMEPSDFEKLIAKYFEARGYTNPQVIGQANDRGVDVLVTNQDGELELIQCKRYRAGNNIGSAVIQRIDSYMRTRHAVRAWVVTTSDFTPEGKDEARITGVLTINGESLIESLNMYFPGKYAL